MEFTPTQQSILAILADGLSHRRLDVLKGLNDSQAELNALHTHICMIRKKLRPMGQDIICELNGRAISYRHVRLLASAVNGH